MIYKKFQDLELSALGLGAMRLPCIDGNEEKIDLDKSAEMVEFALKNGINYFDTAWMYHAGNSEPVMGEILSRYDRNSFYLASKFPGFDKENMTHVKEIFEKQLERCKVDYFDFYLFHNVYEENIDGYLDPQYGIFDYLIEQKKNGRIKHLGFSTHGSMETMQRFLDAYGEYMEFCQIQLNYFDWKFQDAKAKVEMLRERNIPVWVMEPVRGGKLASLDDGATEILKSLRPDESIPTWAFRFLQGIDNVTMTLSGMSNMEQLQENIQTYSEEKLLSQEEYQALMKIADEMIAAEAVPCTACRYCTAKCPKGLDIPALISIMNKMMTDSDCSCDELKQYTEQQLPGACVGCRSCEKVCPQGIKISEVMKKFTAMLGD